MMPEKAGTCLWHPEDISRYESFWSLIHKFALWNSCCAEEILNLLAESSKKEGIRRKSLLIKLYFSIEKLCEFLGLDRFSIKESFIVYYLQKSEVDYLAATTLRYCPECIKASYHSPIHQFLFFDTCPYHQIKLLDHCSSCGVRIPADFTGHNMEYIYSCPKCGGPLCDFSFEKVSEKEASLRALAFKKVSEVLLERQSRRPSIIDVRTYYQSEHSADLFKGFIRDKLWNVWLEVYADKEINDNDCLINYEPDGDFQDQGCDTFFRPERDYKSFLTHGLLSILGRHVRCVVLSARLGWWLSSYWVAKGSTICPYAHAYLLSRMYWEGQDHAQGLFPCGRLINRQVERLEWSIPSVDNTWANKLIFEYLCTRIYFDALVVAFENNEKKMVSFPFKSLPLRKAVYWEYCQKQDEKKGLLFCIDERSARQSKEGPPFTTDHLRQLRLTLLSAPNDLFDAVRKFHPRG